MPVRWPTLVKLLFAQATAAGAWLSELNVIFAPKRGRKMLFDVSDKLAYDSNPLI
jgi:hypothetical protein